MDVHPNEFTADHAICYLGYGKVTEVYNAARAVGGDKFDLCRFMDGMMDLGPVRLEHYLERVHKTSSDKQDS